MPIRRKFSDAEEKVLDEIEAEHCRYRNPRLKLGFAFFHVTWSSIAFVVLMRHSDFHESRNGDALVCSRAELSTTLLLLPFVYASIFFAIAVINVIRMIGIMRVKFLDPLPNHRLGLPRQISYLAYVSLMISTIVGTIALKMVRTMCQTESSKTYWHTSEYYLSAFVIFNWFVLIIAMVKTGSRMLRLEPTRRWKGLLMRILASVDSSPDQTNYSSVIRFMDGIFGDTGRISPGNLWDMMILMRAFHKYRRMSQELSEVSVVDQSPTLSKRMSDDVLHWARWSEAAYGVLGALVNHPRSSCSAPLCCIFDKEKLHLAAFNITAGVDEEDILLVSVASEARLPMFFVVADHKRRTVVVVISGSIRLADFCTDMEASNVSMESIGYPGSFTHSGILQSALNIEETMAASMKLQIFLENHPDYSMTTVGHSLGAGVAAILGITLNRRPQLSGRDIKAWTFGCPPCVSSDLVESQEIQNIVTNVAIEDDLVTRMSFRTLKKLNAQMDLLLQRFNEFQQRHPGLNWTWWSPRRQEMLLAFIQSFDLHAFNEEVDVAVAQQCCAEEYKPMYLPGKIICYREEDGRYGLIDYSDRSGMDEELVVTRKMLLHHMPIQYVYAAQKAEDEA